MTLSRFSHLPDRAAEVWGPGVAEGVSATVAGARAEATVRRRRAIQAFALGVLGVLIAGCGATRAHKATEQLVLSGAVDRSVSEIDFRPISNERVYLDTSYLRSVKGTVFVNADYVISSLRQQIVAAGCLLQDSSKDADVIIEARMGTLGTDDHRVTYGIPESSILQSAASLIPGAPNVPSVPEIAFARREAREAAAKIAVFAYDRKTRRAVWQSGISESTATARDTYVMGVGPFQGGSIREKTRLVGSELLSFDDGEGVRPISPRYSRPMVDYTASTTFRQAEPVRIEMRSKSPERSVTSPDSVKSGVVVQASASEESGKSKTPARKKTKGPTEKLKNFSDAGGSVDTRPRPVDKAGAGKSAKPAAKAAAAAPVGAPVPTS